MIWTKILAMPFIRPLFALGFLAVVLCPSGARAQDTSPALAAQIQTIATAHHGDVALFAENLKTHETVAISPDTPVQTASVIKLAILYEALEQVRSGKAHFDDKITLTKADQVPGSGVMLFFDTPLPLTLKDVLTMMIVMSDNSASNLAMDHLGIGNVDARIAKLGLKDTYLYKKIFTPAPPGVVMPPDQKKFGLGKTTAHEMASLMTKIVRCELAEPGTPAQEGDQALCNVALKCCMYSFTATPYRGISMACQGRPVTRSRTKQDRSMQCGTMLRRSRRRMEW